MLTLQTVLAFFSVSVLLALAPGPDNVFVLVHAAQHGVRAGVLVVLGLCSGLLFHTAAVALGLAAVLATSALAFTVLKTVGALYLLWLAWLSWRAPSGPLQGQADEESAGLSPWQTYGRGVLMNISNPKVAIFFLAFCRNLWTRRWARCNGKLPNSARSLAWLRCSPLAASRRWPGALGSACASQRLRSKH